MSAEPVALIPLCEERKRVWLHDDGDRWRDLSTDDEVVVHCPACADREFDDPSRSARRRLRGHEEAPAAARSTDAMVREEIGRLRTWSERHRRLVARLLIALALTLAIDLVGGVFTWIAERGAKGTEIHTFGQALFFATVQVLTVSSSVKNPLTVTGRVVDVALEAWAVFVITAVGGSFASFFQTGDTSS